MRNAFGRTPDLATVLSMMEQRWIDHTALHKEITARMDREGQALTESLEGVRDDLKLISRQVDRFQGVLWVAALIGPVIGGAVISVLIKLVR